jgi:transposase
MQGLLASHGVRVARQGDVPAQLSQMRQWDGSPLPPALRARLEREWQQVIFLTAQIESLEAERRQLLHTSVEPVVEQVRQLHTLRGIGTNSTWLYVMEFFAWREFRNRKQVGALAGLTPTPHQSGQSCHELGIATAGNRHIRAMAIEMAWGWLRFQPESALSRWYQERVGQGSTRVRKIGIVALARKRLIARWRFLETGVLPQGALCQSQVRIRSRAHRQWLWPERSMLSWCGEPAVPPGSPDGPTVRWGCPPKRFSVRLAANKGWGDRRKSRRHG